MKKEINVSNLSILILRICLSGIFISAGVSHIWDPNLIVTRIENAAYHEFAVFFGDPIRLAISTGYVLFIAGCSLLLGLMTRWSASILFLVLIPITITIQMGNGLMHGPFWKNIALFGGLAFFILNNPKAYTCYNR